MPDLSLLPPSAVVDGEDLRVGGCLLGEVAQEFGTPAYVIDTGALRDRAVEYSSALTSRHRAGGVCFAVKAHPSVSVIRELVPAGLGCDVVGAGELALALAAGADPATIVMHGNAKSDADIAAALAARIGYIVVDGFDDIDQDRAARQPARPRAASGQPRASTRPRTPRWRPAAGTRSSACRSSRCLRRSPGCAPPPRLTCGACTRTSARRSAAVEQFEAAVEALASLERFGVYDFGGGLAVRYVPEDSVPAVDDYVGRLVSAAHRHLGTDIEILIEPGRSMVARAGLTLYRVVTVKQAGKLHVAVDGGMGDNLEPSLYGQRFTPLVLGRWDRAPVRADLVGRHCEEGDVITPDVAMVPPRTGDVVIVPATGAYCFTMANNYNAALRPPLIFCNNGTARIAIRRETFADLLAREVAP